MVFIALSGTLDAIETWAIKNVGIYAFSTLAYRRWQSFNRVLYLSVELWNCDKIGVLRESVTKGSSYSYVFFGLVYGLGAKL